MEKILLGVRINEYGQAEAFDVVSGRLVDGLVSIETNDEFEKPATVTLKAMRYNNEKQTISG